MTTLSDRAATSSRALLPATRGLLGAFTALTGLAVIALLLRADATDQYFAWTISPPISAAFLGSGYAAGCVLVVLSLRSGDWQVVRGPILTILVFTVLTLAASLLHLGRFHFHAGPRVAMFAAWWWTAVYVLLPPAMVAAVLLQDRRSPRREAHRTPVPRGLALPLAAEGVVMLAAGAALFADPGVARTVWPWPLTPLVARAVAAWLVAFAAAAGLALRDGDLARLGCPRSPTPPSAPWSWRRWRATPGRSDGSARWPGSTSRSRWR